MLSLHSGTRQTLHGRKQPRNGQIAPHPPPKPPPTLKLGAEAAVAALVLATSSRGKGTAKHAIRLARKPVHPAQIGYERNLVAEPEEPTGRPIGIDRQQVVERGKADLGLHRSVRCHLGTDWPGLMRLILMSWWSWNSRAAVTVMALLSALELLYAASRGKQSSGSRT